MRFDSVPLLDGLLNIDEFEEMEGTPENARE
jgi:hypothetical protein